VSDDVTLWIGQLAEGDESAARLLWQRYQADLLEVARRKLGGSSRRVADEEDVALSAFHSFCQAASAGRFELGDRSELWRLLVTITTRKALAQIKRNMTLKRGGGAVRGESVFINGASDASNAGIHCAAGDDPGPEFVAIVTEEYQRLLECLDEEPLRRVALYKLEGYTNDEIARKMECATRSVERKLMRIRQKWEEERGRQTDPE